MNIESKQQYAKDPFLKNMVEQTRGENLGGVDLGFDKLTDGLSTKDPKEVRAFGSIGLAAATAMSVPMSAEIYRPVNEDAAIYNPITNSIDVPAMNHKTGVEAGSTQLKVPDILWKFAANVGGEVPGTDGDFYRDQAARAEIIRTELIASGAFSADALRITPIRGVGGAEPFPGIQVVKGTGAYVSYVYPNGTFYDEGGRISLPFDMTEGYGTISAGITDKLKPSVLVTSLVDFDNDGHPKLTVVRQNVKFQRAKNGKLTSTVGSLSVLNADFEGDEKFALVDKPQTQKPSSEVQMTQEQMRAVYQSVELGLGVPDNVQTAAKVFEFNSYGKYIFKECVVLAGSGKVVKHETLRLLSYSAIIMNPDGSLRTVKMLADLDIVNTARFDNGSGLDYAAALNSSGDKGFTDRFPSNTKGVCIIAYEPNIQGAIDMYPGYVAEGMPKDMADRNVAKLRARDALIKELRGGTSGIVGNDLPSQQGTFLLTGIALPRSK